MIKLPYTRIRDFADNPSARLFWGKIPLERAFSFVAYHHESISHELLMQLKYGHRPDLGFFLGAMMANKLLPDGFFEGVDCILAVPLHWKRQMMRGYNQSIQMSRGISKVTGIPLLRHTLVRSRNNPSQTSQSASERVENVENLFCVRRHIPFHHVLLVDDVLTTSATLTACARAILEKEPDMRFSVLTLAKA